MGIKLSQQQLEFLIIVDMQDDWHPAYFLEKVTEYYTNINEKPFNRPEFENMMRELKALTTERVANLQKALCAFGNI
ncbi:hypothetical protein LC605_32690 [Nostoc sp. CHAB 5836]|nr:hypothetical protein [Nostoc sp. CHAB 5836]